MWIAGWRWREVERELKQLREKVWQLEHGTRVYFDNGKVHAFSEGHYRLEDAVNVIAEHVGVQFKVRPAVAAAIAVGPAPGKSEKQP